MDYSCGKKESFGAKFCKDGGAERSGFEVKKSDYMYSTLAIFMF